MTTLNPGRSRRPRWGAVCALVLTCASAVSARPQDSTAAATAKKPATKTTARKHPATSVKSSTTQVAGKHSSRRKKSVRVKGQQKIDTERATAIQEALIREHYLSGEAKGTWNQASEDAMRKYQADHGWQSKQVPDSRALIKLGLGPSKDHLLNPESAMTTVPDAPRAQSMPTASQGPAPVSSAPSTPVQNDSPQR